MHFDRLSSAPVVQLIAAGALGLLVAPGVLARDGLGLGMSAQRAALAAEEPSWQELVWLTVAVLVVGWSLALFPALGRALDRRLGRFLVVTTNARADLPLLTRLALGASYVVLIQAVLRRPLVRVLGPSFERFVVEAAFGAVMLLLLFGLLVALHRTARPLVGGLAWLALDTAFATSGSATAVTEPIEWTDGAPKRAATTVAASGPTRAAPELTQPATRPTLAATEPNQPATEPKPATTRLTRAATEPTLAATEPRLAPTQATAAAGDGQQTVPA